MKRGIIIFLSFLLVGLLSTCKKNDSVIAETGKDYFPIEEGLYTIYKVDSILMQAGLERFDTSTFFLKEILDSTYIDGSGNEVAVLRRMKRRDEADPWIFADAWTMYRSGSRAHRVEENEDLLVMSLPPSLNSEWNMNAYNTRESWKASYTAIHESMTTNELFFDSTVTVSQETEVTLVSRRSEERVYAKHVGLIHRSLNSLEFNAVVPEDSTPTSDQIAYGVILEYNILSYGKE